MRRSRALSTVVVLAAISLAGRGAAYEVVAVTDGGTLSGKVTYEGTPPEPAKIPVTKDPDACGKEKIAPHLLVCADGGIANVVIEVKAAKGKKLEPAAENPVFDQKACEFRPHVLIFPAGTTIDVLNSDGILHNVHTASTVNPPTNQAQPKFKPKINVKIDKPEWPIAVKCDVHPWMIAYWVSQGHPYFAVTDESGAFKIGDLPPGDYEVEIWQEKLGKQTQSVTIKPNEVTSAAWTMK